MSTMYSGNTSTSFYIGLSSTAPAADGSGITEPTGGSYGRALIDGFTAPVNGVVRNRVLIKFPESTADWFTSENPARYYIIFDGSGVNAHVLAAGNLVPQMEIPIDSEPTIAPGVLRISLLGDTA